MKTSPGAASEGWEPPRGRAAFQGRETALLDFVCFVGSMLDRQDRVVGDIDESKRLLSVSV